jgi:zinc/manganese transport system substrate-binding protein
MRPVVSRVLAVLAAVLALSGAAACSSTTPNAHGRIPVVAAENFWGDVARQIGGSRVQVTSIISDPSADPHLYESDARDAEAIASARVVVANGLGYDDFIGKLLSTTSSDHRVVITAASLRPAVAHDANPHLWYDLQRVRLVADAVEHALAQAAPKYAAEFASNRSRFEQSLLPIQGVLAVIRQRFVAAPVAYTERVPEYLIDEAGLVNRTPSGFARAIEDGNEPSAGDQQHMLEQLRGPNPVHVLLYNAQASSSVTRSVLKDASAAGIPVVAVTETMPRGARSYAAWQLAQVNALLHTLQQKAPR